MREVWSVVDETKTTNWDTARCRDDPEGAAAEIARLNVLCERKIRPNDPDGRKILAVYAHFNAEPGTSLNARNFLVVGSRLRWSADDIQRDLALAVACGWVISTKKGFELSAAGYKELPSSS
jgi:hypothetical protein